MADHLYDEVQIPTPKNREEHSSLASIKRYSQYAPSWIMGISGRITSVELRDLLLSLVALVIAFSVLRARGLPGLDTLDTILISAVGVSSGFLLHEMAHKFVALHFGYWAEYRANMVGLALAIVMAFGGFLFAAPGAVMISKLDAPQELYMQDSFGQEEQRIREKREMLWISLAGPMTNIVLAILFFLMFVFLLVSRETGSDLWVQSAYFAFFINLILAAFNMLPFGPLDGKKIFDSNRLVWTLVGVPTILVALPVYLGMI
jgi:Zn-dependent protease